MSPGWWTSVWAVRAVARRNVRVTGVAARYGGDAFVLLLSDTEPEGAHVVAEKLVSDIFSIAIGSLERPALENTEVQ